LIASGGDYAAIGSAARIDWINPASIGGRIAHATARTHHLAAGARPSIAQATPRTHHLAAATRPNIAHAGARTTLKEAQP
jgi:hypothetical protein